MRGLGFKGLGLRYIAESWRIMWKIENEMDAEIIGRGFMGVLQVMGRKVLQPQILRLKSFS